MLTSQQMSDLLASIDAEELKGKDPYALAAIRVAFWTGWRASSEILPLKSKFGLRILPYIVSEMREYGR